MIWIIIVIKKIFEGQIGQQIRGNWGNSQLFGIQIGGNYFECIIERNGEVEYEGKGQRREGENEKVR